MKKIILILLISCSLCYAKADNEKEKYEVYCEVVYFKNAFSKETVNIYYDGEKYDINDKDGNNKLKSATQVMRLLSKKGWVLRTSFAVNGNNMLPVEHHYVMVKVVSSDNEILEGLKER